MNRLNLHEITYVFLALKLSGHLDWPWWKVLIPSFVEALLSIIFVAVKNYMLGKGSIRID